jgi:membrane-associated protein
VHLLAAASSLNPEHLIAAFGTIGLLAIIFAESGLLIGFFLPGDSLLFTAGLLASQGKLNLAAVVVGCFIAAVVGDQVGYWFGKKVGPSLFDRPKSRLFDPKNVLKAHLFFERYGAKTIVLARFVPIVRTFAPVVAGVGTMRYRTFVTYNLIGALLWGAGVTTLGYFLGSVDVVKNNIEIAIVAIIAVSLLPVTIELIRHRRQARHEREAGQQQVAAD